MFEILLIFILLQYSSISPNIFIGAVGSIKFIVPSCTADAPAIINSTTSYQFIIPPIPIIGISTFWCTSKTFAKAIGFIAGPDKPPVIFWIFGFPV